MVQIKFTESLSDKKFQFTIFDKTPKQSIVLNTNQIKIEESQKVVLTGLAIDNWLTFKDQIDMIC